MTTGRILSAFVAITIVKIAVFVSLNATGRAAPFVGDNAVDHYIPIAHRLLNEGRFNGPDSRLDSKVPPGYSTVLATLLAVAPRQYLLLAVVLQMIADLITAVVLFWIGRRFVGVLEGALAGLVWLVYPPEVALSTWITAETMFTTLFIVSIAVLLWSLTDKDAWRSFVAGILLGATTLLRGTTIALPILFLPLALPRHAYRWATFLIVGFALLIAPWAIRNRVVLQDPIVVAVGFGGAFMQGADEVAFTIDGKHVAFPQMYDSAARAGIVKPATDHEGAIDSWLFAVGMHRYVERFRTEPLSFIPFMAKKFLWLWFSTESGTFRGQLILALCSLPFVLPGLVQVVRWARTRTTFGIVVAIICAYFIALHIATGPLNRYMLPIYPLLILGASTWFVSFVEARLGSRHSELLRRVEIPV